MHRGVPITARATANTRVHVVTAEQSTPRTIEAFAMGDATITKDNHPPLGHYVMAHIPAGSVVPKGTQNGKTNSNYYTWRYEHMTLTLFTGQWLCDEDLQSLPGRTVCLTNMTLYVFPAYNGKLIVKASNASYVMPTERKKSLARIF